MIATRLVCAAAAMVAVVSIAGCGGGSTTTPTATSAANAYLDDRSASVTAMLRDFGSALRAGDAARARSFVDPGADTAFAQLIADAAGSVSALRPVHLEYGVDASTAGSGTGLAETLVPDDLQRRLDAEGASDSWVAPVVVDYAIGGVDSMPTRVKAPMVLVRHDDSWRILGYASSVLHSGSAPALPWDHPGLLRTDVRTGDVDSVVLSYPGSRALAQRITAAFPSAVRAVTDFWGEQWSQGAVVEATDTPAQFAALGGGGTDPASAAAATVYDRVVAGKSGQRRVALGQRVVFTPQAVTELPGATLGVVLRHELTHVATRTRTAEGAPLWVTEGTAEYVGRFGTFTTLDEAAPDLAASVRANGPPSAPPSDAAFTLSGPDAQLAYQQAWSMIDYIAGRYGRARTVSLYVAMAAGPETTAQQDASISTTLGVSGADLVSGWQSWLRTQASH
ncbi:hypothetical protein GCM10027169_09720 [Gordonia jinhuaensis]|uniref:Peptidase MA-like domain-containing protein n=1 Tax=Gordonia jinhuaensis TaxID=1517702 RepID=A0A916SXS7_9ACTN|nr:hypothetical protein [Gordonia jinhuaensis]GGB18997.1 hypothetical protein GCM10011489_03880 [Gordonia jinhuaensis]